jgi:hypothetical protein
MYQHEIGTDEIDGQNVLSIPSSFETNDLGWVSGGPSQLTAEGQNRWIRLDRIEPDFIQSGPMSVQVTGRANPRAPEVLSQQWIFEETATQPYEQIVMMKEMRRELRVRFESNAVGGDYQMGQIIGHIDSGDRTVLE